MPPLLAKSSLLLHQAWRALRDWCGDSAYERYTRVARKNGLANAILSPRDFYVDQLNRRYSRPNRCC